jgi:undecaprenyl diphosphate synthase
VVRMLGDVGLLPRDVQLAAADVVNKTVKNTGACRLNVCFAYSGEEEVREVCDALGRAVGEGRLTREDVTPALVRRTSYLGLRDAEPDVVVRTSGETRLSDFMLLHAGSAHLAFIDVLWPQLSFWDLYRVVLDWQRCAGAGGGAGTAEEDLAALTPRAKAFLERREAEYEAFWKKLGER